MAEIVRFGVSLEEDLLDRFDSLVGKFGYKSRSDAIRHLIREKLVGEECADSNEEIVGVLGLVFNHEVRELTETLTSIQHEYTRLIISSSHIHLDKHNCLEVIIMKGKSSLVRKVADTLISTRSVKHGDLITTTTGHKIG
ncbi:MAG: nickel-responsive transcriptional regulator NikR [Candidatus Aminicenantales bacterium]